jgi:hypothetical protein
MTKREQGVAPKCADVDSLAAVLRVTPHDEWPDVPRCSTCATFGTCAAFEAAVERVLQGWTQHLRDTLTAAVAEIVLATPERDARDVAQMRAAADRLARAQELVTSAARLGHLVAADTTASPAPVA